MPFPTPTDTVITGVELMTRLMGREDRVPPEGAKAEGRGAGLYREVAAKFGIPGRDHASCLLYLQTIEANHGGDVKGHRNGEHMRCKHRTHREGAFPQTWDPGAGSRLWDGSVLIEHDDYDCLADLESIGLLVDSGTGMYPRVALTEVGHQACAALIAHRRTQQNRRQS